MAELLKLSVWTETPLQVHLFMENLAINHWQFIAQHLVNTKGHVVEADTRKNIE